MAIAPLTYSKDWSVQDPSNVKYFPTHETDETQVRNDMQLLYNEIQNYLNEIVVPQGLGDASNMGIGEHFSWAEDADTVKQVLQELHTAIVEIVEVAVPNHSISKAKLTDDTDEAGPAVGTANIEKGAVTTDKLADGISGSKIQDGSIGNGKLVADATGSAAAVGTNNINNEAVLNRHIKNYSLTHSKLATTANPDGAAVWGENIKDGDINPVTKLDNHPVPMSKGGLEVDLSTTAGKATARTNLGLGSVATENTVPVAKGGTGATTVAGARNALGLGNTDGAVPIANGGTGATTAAGAIDNLGYEEETWSFTPKTGSAFSVVVLVKKEE